MARSHTWQQRATEGMPVYSVVDKSKKKKNRASESSTIVSWCGFQYSIEVRLFVKVVLQLVTFIALCFKKVKVFSAVLYTYMPV